MRKSKIPIVGTTVLGIDPGYADMGYGCIRVEGAVRTYLASGSIRTSAKQAMPERLATLYHELITIIRRYHPALMAVEKLFFFKNVSTAIEVAHARGIALLAAAEHDIPVVEYTPLEVKLSLTSHGRADKRQVAHMVKTLLGAGIETKNDNALDALAIALTAAFHLKIQK